MLNGRHFKYSQRVEIVCGQVGESRRVQLDGFGIFFIQFNVQLIMFLTVFNIEKIRLLTGIAHYTEMTYIMDYLWNNHQFEMLFGKGICKVDYFNSS
jgi:hypothetical protein